jgi:putative ABC transport system permease protein
MPEGTRLVAGQWWPADYAGPPLISLDASLARGFGVGIGDTLTLSILGREIEATVASTRDIDWRSLRFDFAIIFSPGVLEGAPQTHMAAVQVRPESEEAVERAGTDAFPNVSAVRVREALEAVARILDATSLAIRSTAGVSIVAGVLVLAGAIAAGRRRRLYDAVVFKVLGATRRTMTVAFLAEYGTLGLLTGLIVAAVGTLAAWAVIVHLMRAEWFFLPQVVAVTVVASVVVTVAVGFIGTWRALGQKAAFYLRNE